MYTVPKNGDFLIFNNSVNKDYRILVNFVTVEWWDKDGRMPNRYIDPAVHITQVVPIKHSIGGQQLTPVAALTSVHT